MLVLGFLGLFLVSTGVSLAGFTFLVKDTGTKINNISPSGKVSRVDLSKPKTESCPINGEMFTKEQKNLWLTKRPIVAVIENHLESRPQSGLSKADLVYEIVAEGGITRFLAVFIVLLLITTILLVKLEVPEFTSLTMLWNMEIIHCLCIGEEQTI